MRWTCVRGLVELLRHASAGCAALQEQKVISLSPRVNASSTTAEPRAKRNAPLLSSGGSLHPRKDFFPKIIFEAPQVRSEAVLRCSRTSKPVLVDPEASVRRPQVRGSGPCGEVPVVVRCPSPSWMRSCESQDLKQNIFQRRRNLFPFSEGETRTLAASYLDARCDVTALACSGSSATTLMAEGLKIPLALPRDPNFAPCEHLRSRASSDHQTNSAMALLWFLFALLRSSSAFPTNGGECPTEASICPSQGLGSIPPNPPTTAADLRAVMRGISAIRDVALQTHVGRNCSKYTPESHASMFRGIASAAPSMRPLLCCRE